MTDHRRPTQLRRRSLASAPLAQASLRGLTLRPTLATGALASLAWAAHHAAHAPLAVTVSGTALAWCGLVWHSVRRADAAFRGTRGHLEYLVQVVAGLRTSVAAAVERVEQGDLPGAAAPAFAGELPADPALAIEQLLFVVRGELDHAIRRAAQVQQQNMLGERAQTELLRTIAQRQSALVSRTLEALDKAEARIEDPDTLHDLFRIDNLVTRLRRSTENIAILGGQGVPGRPREPLLVFTVLRRAVEEIEGYDRVRVAPAPDKLSFPGHVGPSVVHLLAELLENAAQFSDSRTLVRLAAAEEQGGGLVISVQDQGVSMEPAQLHQLNQQLAAPHTVDVYARLKAGRIGLVVTGQLAQRFGIRVELYANTKGRGVNAFVLVPRTALLTTPLPAEVAPAPTAWPPHQGRSELAAHLDHVPPAPAAQAAHLLAGDAPEGRPHKAEVPTVGRSPLPRRPASAAPSQASGPPVAAPGSSKGPTPGLFADFRAGSRTEPSGGA